MVQVLVCEGRLRFSLRILLAQPTFEVTLDTGCFVPVDLRR